MNSSEEQFPMLVLQDYPKHYLTPKKLLSEAIDFTHKQQQWNTIQIQHLDCRVY